MGLLCLVSSCLVLSLVLTGTTCPCSHVLCLSLGNLPVPQREGFEVPLHAVTHQPMLPPHPHNPWALNNLLALPASFLWGFCFLWLWDMPRRETIPVTPLLSRNRCGCRDPSSVSFPSWCSRGPGHVCWCLRCAGAHVGGTDGVTTGKRTSNADRKCLVLQWKRMMELPHWKAEALGVGSVCTSLHVFIISFYRKHLKSSVVALAAARHVADPARTPSLWGFPCFEPKDIPRAEECMCTP